MPKLFVFSGRRKEGTFPLNKRSMVVGRAEDVDVHIESPLVSRRHAEVAFTGGEWRVRDLDTKNGLFLNGKRVQDEVLRLGDRIEIGKHLLVFDADDGPSAAIETLDDYRSDGGPAEETTRLPPPEVQLLQQRARARRRAHLVIGGGPTRREVALEGTRYSIGFAADCDVRLPGSTLFGKRAGELTRARGGIWTLKALSSMTPIKRNGERLNEGVLNDGDRLEIKGVDLVFHSTLLS